SNDVTRLQALVDKKKVVITEDTIRDALHLDDAEGVDCLPNEEIFTELAQEQVQDDIDAAAAQGDNIVVPGDEALDACAALARRVEHLEYDKVAQYLEITKLKRRVKQLERGNKVKVLKLKRLKKVRTSQRIESSDDTNMKDSSNQGRIIDELDMDEGVALMDDEGAEKKVEKAQEDEPEVQEVVDVVTTAKLITEYELLLLLPEEEKEWLSGIQKRNQLEDLESLWSLVKERFSTSKPNNFSDDYLLTTLGALFERPDEQA
nr:hypothetical protein [Tanacetum cinerariifolium]